MGQPSSGEWPILLVLPGGKALVPLCSAPPPPARAPRPSSWLAYRSFLPPILAGTCQVPGWRTALDYPARQVILAPEFALAAAWLPVGAGSVVSEESTEKEDLCCPLGLSLLQRRGVAGRDGVPTLPEMRPGGRPVTWERGCPCAKDRLGDAGSQGAESAGSWAPGWGGFKWGSWRVTSECGEGWLGWRRF